MNNQFPISSYLTGFRNGSDASTGAKTQAFGATTLQAEHVSIDGDKVTFDYQGKKGVRQHHTVIDAGLARDLEARSAAGGALFDTNSRKALNYLRSISDVKDIKVHDLRLWNATELAKRLIDNQTSPETESDYWLMRDKISQVVATKLGDTAKVVLESYIDPIVFEKWRETVNVQNEDRPRISQKQIKE